MLDIVRGGGISEIRKIATIGEAYYIPVSPHDATGPITMAAGAQVMMSTLNFCRTEIAYSELPCYNAALIPLQDVRDGIFHVPKTLDLGHELNPDYVAVGPPIPAGQNVNDESERDAQPTSLQSLRRIQRSVGARYARRGESRQSPHHPTHR